jgi:hypothetical protein
MKFGNEFWLILFREYIIPKLFAVHSLYKGGADRGSAQPGIQFQRGNMPRCLKLYEISTLTTIYCKKG